MEFLGVEIYEMREETFYAYAIFRANSIEHTIDCCPGDAVALALNRNIPILVHQALFPRKLTQEEINEYEGLVKSMRF